MLHHFAKLKKDQNPFFLEFERFIYLGITALLASLAVFFLNSYTKDVFDQKAIMPVAEEAMAQQNDDSAKIANDKPEIVGFLPSWSVAKNAKVFPEYLDQIIYFGIGINKNGELMLYDEQGKTLLEWNYFLSDNFKAIRSQAKITNTKILMSVKNFDNEEIDTLISSPTNSKRAIKNLSRLLSDYELDGINIDFEYFTSTDFPTLKYYNSFLTDLQAEMKKQKPDSILSVDINATAVYKDNAYDVVKIGDVVDQLIIMGYDYHVPQSTKSGPVSPINSEGEDASLNRTVMSLKGRIEPQKVILAVPFYGYEWQTYSKDYESFAVPHTGALATYKRVKELLASRDDLTVSYDDLSQSPRIVYTQNGLIKQIYYEDEKSLENKLKFIRSHKLGGMGLWALGYEGDYIEPWQLLKNYR